MNDQSLYRTVSAVTFLLLMMALLSPLAVTYPQDTKVLPSQEAPQAAIDGSQLEPFAGAYKEVTEIHTAYKQRILESTDPAQTDNLQQEANQKMNQVVKDHGLTVEAYNKIFKAILKDPALKEEFLTVLNRTQ